MLKVRLYFFLDKWYYAIGLFLGDKKIPSYPPPPPHPQDITIYQDEEEKNGIMKVVLRSGANIYDNCDSMAGVFAWATGHIRISC